MRERFEHSRAKGSSGFKYLLAILLMKYLVHLIPPIDVSRRIVDLRAELDLKDTTYTPHITLYTIRAQESDEQKMVDVLSRVRFAPFDVALDSFDRFDEDALVALVRKGERILGLHDQVITGLKSFVDWADTKEYSGSEEFRRDIAKIYGSGYVAQGYNPHITIGHGDCGIPLVAELKGVSFRIDAFFLAKKKEGVWSVVNCFSSR